MSHTPATDLVTAAGAAGTAGTIMRPRGRGYRVVATGMDADAPGLYLAILRPKPKARGRVDLYTINGTEE
ncbi:hypothetical protein ACFO4E_16235 [Nocardiopsis mangrovi]|uniref:Uncharacterized protein n=1 Tax=Nocardiopsis mangrovi TaxID=1179818 RepID=A0ABV9DX30_9ACTN